MAADEELTDYERGYEDALAEGEKRDADDRMSWDEYQGKIRRGFDAEAAQALAEGRVGMPDYVESALAANRVEAETRLGSSFDPASPIPVAEMDEALHRARMRDSGFPA